MAVVLVLALLLSHHPISEGTTVYFRVTNVFATPGGLVGFVLDYSRAIASGAMSGPLVEFYLSKNSYAAITNEDVLLARAIATPTTSLIFGTLRLPEGDVVRSMLGSEAGVMYIKATDGSSVAVSSIYVDANPMKPFAALRLSATRIAAEPVSELSVSNSIKVRIDLSVYMSEEAPWLRSYSAVILRRDGAKLSLVEYNHTRCRHTSDVFWRIAVSDGEIELSQMKSFPLHGPLSVRSYSGVPYSYASYTVEFLAGPLVKHMNAIKLDAGRQENTVPRDYEDVEVKASIAWPKSQRLEIYPTASIRAVDRGKAGAPDELNVGDRIVVSLINVPPEAELHLQVYALTVSGFVKIGEAPLGHIISRGDTQIELELPPMQYGGRRMAFVIYAGEAAVVATRDGRIFVENVRPHLGMWSYDDLGRPSETKHIAPGSYILVIGRGFLAEDLMFDLVSAEHGAGHRISALETVLSTGVLANGSIAAILRVPVGYLPPQLDETRTAVRARGSGDNLAVAGRSRLGAAHLVLDFDGEAAVVYVNPRPSLRSVIDPRANVILLGMPLAYAYRATWEPEELRVATVEAIGLPRQWAVRAVNVSLLSVEPVIEGYPGWRPVGLVIRNQPVSFGYFRAQIQIPELPYTRRGYMVYIGNSTCCPYAICSNPAREAAIMINATLAAVGLDGQPRVMVALPAPRNVTLIGYGWAPLRDLVLDVVPIAGARNLPVGVSAANGTVRVVFLLESYVTEAGTYYLTLKHATGYPELRRTVVISVKLLPRFHLTVLAPPESYSDRDMTIWVIAKFEEAVASTSQIVRIGARVLSDACERVLALTPYGGQKAIYRAKIVPAELCGRGIGGVSMLIEVEATGRFDNLSPDQVSAAYASVVIRHRTLAEELSNATFVIAGLRLLERMMNGLVGSSAELRSLVESVLLSTRSAESALGVIFASQESARLMLGEIERRAALLSNKMDVALRDLNVTLRRLSDAEAALADNSMRLIALGGDVSAVISLLRAVNASISRLIVDSSGLIGMEVRSVGGSIIGAIVTNMSSVRGDLSQLARLLSDESAATRSLLRGLSDEMARLRFESVGRLSQLGATLDTVLNDVRAGRAEVRETLISIRDLTSRVAAISSKIEIVGSDVSRAANASIRVAGVAERLASKDDLRALEGRVLSQLAALEASALSAESSSKEAAGLASQQRVIAVINVLLALILLVLIARLSLRLLRQ